MTRRPSPMTSKRVVHGKASPWWRMVITRRRAILPDAPRLVDRSIDDRRVLSSAPDAQGLLRRPGQPRPRPGADAKRPGLAARAGVPGTSRRGANAAFTASAASRKKASIDLSFTAYSYPTPGRSRDRLNARSGPHPGCRGDTPPDVVSTPFLVSCGHPLPRRADTRLVSRRHPPGVLLTPQEGNTGKETHGRRSFYGLRSERMLFTHDDPSPRLANAPTPAGRDASAARRPGSRPARLPHGSTPSH